MPKTLNDLREFTRRMAGDAQLTIVDSRGRSADVEEMVALRGTNKGVDVVVLAVADVEGPGAAPELPAFLLEAREGGEES